ncbi:hypothetical protein BUALT_Bualt18G0071700 [Buddleja alternifolia]|uniref:Bifunctional inhibitor/plant lipid transfer protein/seed storage helical domain-containing protein n=1 Tax=Buddleja alternifolia TaxID=168488 RepID=A0AAV6W523_9LAMI|nr:hypothetical protein BUALT_Bualt18G0071700 [Buddleja alternifolia]
MGNPLITLLLISTLAAVLIASATGDAAAATPSTVCNVKVSELAECIPAITGKSPPWPTKSCCSVMHKANLHCFCNFKSELKKYGVDPNNAMKLPGKCGLKLPRECNKKFLH